MARVCFLCDKETRIKDNSYFRMENRRDEIMAHRRIYIFNLNR